jgi:hypothetical protein
MAFIDWRLSLAGRAASLATMVRIFAAAALLAAPVALGPAFAQPEPSTTTEAGAPRIDPKDRLYATNEALDASIDKVVCRVEQKTGSRLGAKRVCKTRSEWASEAELARTEMRRMDDARAAAIRANE